MTYAFLYQVFLRSCLYERRGGTKKTGVHDKTEKENLFHQFFIELLLEHVTASETGTFGISPDKGKRVQYFVYPLPFYKQPVDKQTVLPC